MLISQYKFDYRSKLKSGRRHSAISSLIIIYYLYRRVSFSKRHQIPFSHIDNNNNYTLIWHYYNILLAKLVKLKCVTDTHGLVATYII